MNVRIPQIMIRNLAAAALSLGFLALSTPLMAQDDFAYGRRLFLDKAQCSYCHGWAGDGNGEPRSPGRAPSLRKSMALPTSTVAPFTSARTPRPAKLWERAAAVGAFACATIARASGCSDPASAAAAKATPAPHASTRAAPHDQVRTYTFTSIDPAALDAPDIELFESALASGVVVVATPVSAASTPSVSMLAEVKVPALVALPPPNSKTHPSFSVSRWTSFPIKAACLKLPRRLRLSAVCP